MRSEFLLRVTLLLSLAQAVRDYLPELERSRAIRQKTLDDAKADSMDRMMKDLELDRARNPSAALADQWDPNAEDDPEDDELDVNLIDSSEFCYLYDHHYRANCCWYRRGSMAGPIY